MTAWLFAAPGAEKCESESFDTIRALECETHDTTAAGDPLILPGCVARVRDGLPPVYFNGFFHGFHTSAQREAAT
jgi:hypothetical protein